MFGLALTGPRVRRLLDESFLSANSDEDGMSSSGSALATDGQGEPSGAPATAAHTGPPPLGDSYQSPGGGGVPLPSASAGGGADTRSPEASAGGGGYGGGSDTPPPAERRDHHSRPASAPPGGATLIGIACCEFTPIDVSCSGTYTTTILMPGHACVRFKRSSAAAPWPRQCKTEYSLPQAACALWSMFYVLCSMVVQVLCMSAGQ